MTQENKRQIDELMENTPLLLDTIASEIIRSTEKIYGCYIPGEITPSLFNFKDRRFLEDFKINLDVITNIIKTNITTLPYEKSDEALILANLLLEMNELDLATQMYENLLKVNPENKFAWTNLMAVYIKQNKNEKAMECYLHLPPDFLEHAVEEKKDPTLDVYRVLNVTTAYPLHSSISSLGDRIQESGEERQEYEEELRELYTMKEFGRGQEALANGNYDQAFVQFSSLESKMPDSHLLQFFIGKAALEGKHYLIAEENFKKAIQLKNDIPEYWNELASCFLAQHKNDQAVKALKTALTLDPSCKECWSLAGAAISTIESLEEYDYFIKQIQLMPSAEAILEFVTGLIQKKRFENALEILQIGVSKFPEDSKILVNFYDGTGDALHSLLSTYKVYDWEFSEGENDIIAIKQYIEDKNIEYVLLDLETVSSIELFNFTSDPRFENVYENEVHMLFEYDNDQVVNVNLL